MRATITAGSFLLLWVLHAQPAPAPATFEVVSIKPCAPDTSRIFYQVQPGGGLRADCVTVKTLVAHAYGVREYQISGGPAWVDSERYGIIAKAEPSPGLGSRGSEAMEERLKAMLTDRFHLISHRETKEGPVYVLVVAKSGPKLKEAQEGDPPTIRVNTALGGQHKRQMDAQATPIPALTGALATVLGRSVLDKTGLAGKYNLHLEWVPEASPSLGGVDFSLADGPSIFAALQEQVGLRLESQKGLAEVIVIEHVERPTGN